MSQPQSQLYQLPRELTEDNLLTLLAAPLRTRAEPTVRRRRTVLDTFDGRLTTAGAAMWVEDAQAKSGGSKPAGLLLFWQGGPGEMVRHQPLPRITPPAFAADLPADASDLAALAARIAPRRLLPLAVLEEEILHLAVLDSRDKTVVRLARLTVRVMPQEGDAVELPPLLELTPVKGYDDAHARLTAVLADEMALPATPAPLLPMALAAAGVDFEARSSKFEVALEPTESADRSLRKILRRLVEIVEINAEGTRRDLDPEFLHDFRVAVRRTRALLGQVKGVLAAEDFRRQLAWLGRLTGPTRDLDVYLLKLEDYAADLPEEVRGDLEPLRAHLVRRQRREQRRLARALKSERYRRLLETWHRLTEQDSRASGGSPELPHAARPILEVASKRLRKVYRRLLRRGLAITQGDGPGEPDALHSLRIQGKKLRYLLEFFRGLYPPDEIGRLVKELKRLQDNLGDFNDYEVQRESLEEMAGEMAAAASGETASEAVPGATLLVMGRLMARLEAGQEAERRNFRSCFERFSRPETRELFERLFSGEAAS